MKKAWNILYTAFTWVLMLVAFVVMIFTIISVTTVDRNNRELFGYRAYIVLSDSMSATDFDAGDLVVIRETDVSSLQPGDIITFQSRNAHNYGETVTHKIRQRVATANGMPGFVTYGTTTGADDEAIVGYSDILGEYVFSIPKLGSFFVFLKTPNGYICCILIPFLLLIGMQGWNCVKAFREYKAEELAQIQAEKAALEQERKKTEAMMESLLQMQAQILNATSNRIEKPAEPEKPEEPEVQTEPETPAEPEKAEEPDLAALLAELEMLRAQLKQTQNKAEETDA